jgi:dienelactone hydrolase
MRKSGGSMTRFLARLVGALATVALCGVAPAASPQLNPGDEWLAKPVDDRTFKSFLDLFTYDRKQPLDVRTIGNDEQDGIKREHLSYQSTPGVRVFAHLYHPLGSATGNRPALIMLHGGAAAGKANLAPRARNLARAGFTVLALDLQHFGERSTDLLTTFTEQEKHERLYNQQAVYLAWVAQTVKDVSRAVDLLAERLRTETPRVGLLGYSRGGILGVIAAAAERRLAAMVMFYGGHVDALDRAHLPAACPANYIGRVSPRPILMLNGTLDADMVQATSVEPLFRLARAPKDILWSEGGHMAVSEQNHAQMVQWMREKVK